MWEDPAWSAFYGRAASFSRLILFDKRGTGLSDRVSVQEMPTLEQRMDDVRAVMDAVGSESAFVLGVSEGGPMSLLFAATHPERTRGLVLYGSFPRIMKAADYPWGFEPEQLEPSIELAERTWGEGTFSGGLIAPSQLPDRLPFFARLERDGASPGAMIALIRMLAEIDVRGVLPSVSVPTLIVHRDRDAIASVDGARDMAAHIAGARLVVQGRALPTQWRQRCDPRRDRGVHNWPSPGASSRPRTRYGFVHRHRRLHVARGGAGRSSVDRAARRPLPADP